MNIIHFSPNFPENYHLFSVCAKKNGANVLGIGDASFESLSVHLRKTLTEYFRVENMGNYEDVLRAVAYFTYKYGKIDRYESFNEYWLEQDAQIRTDFNILGLTSSVINEKKRKSQMKRIYQEAGIKVARGKIVNNYKEALNFIEEVGYPVVAKPDIGVGALSTFKITNLSDLEYFFETKPNLDYIMEEFISGEIISFDGLTNQNGEIVFYTAHVFQNGIMEVVNEDSDMYYYSLREIPEDLREIGFRTVKAFDIRERFFHLEFFRTFRTKEIIALEVNLRPPGGFTTDMFNYANDIDIYQEWANVVMFNEFKANYSRKYHVCYVGRKRNFTYINSHQQIMERYSSFMSLNAPVSGIFRAAIGDYAYIFRSENFDAIKEIIEFILEK